MIDSSIFKAYDIRGIIGESLTEESIYKIGKAIGSEALEQNQNNICVGYDGRLSSPKISKILIEGLRSTGINTIDINLVTTPILYFSTIFLETKNGVMITGSHNPPNYNGFKIVINETTLSSDAIQKLKHRIINEEYREGKGDNCKKNIISDYKDKILNTVKLKRKMKVAIDCGNGSAGVIASELFQELGVDTTMLFEDVDGNFPNHHPDPSKPKNLEKLIDIVKNSDCELGLAFDGDADRLGLVNKDGEIIFPDRQLMLFAKSILKNNPNKKVIYDVKSSRHLYQWIKDHGGEPIIWKTGHSLIKKKMKESGAILAGEMSGHTFIKDNWYGFDDGIYAGARMLEILSHESQSIQEALSSLPKSFSTPEINIEVNEGEQHKIIKSLQMNVKFSRAKEIIMIDGLRVEYDTGFGLMRASNTTPVIVLRFEAETQKDLIQIQADFKAILQTVINPDLIPF
jgi:phosphomannomutase/phosphoglucomutase